MIDSLEKQRFIFIGKLDSLTNIIDQKFPDFNQEKFDNRVLTLEETQSSLTADQVMIEYYFSENFLHQIIINRDSVIYRTISEPDSLVELLEAFNDKLRLTKHDYSRNDVAVYQDLASRLYNILLKPNEDMLIGKELIILPDESLSYIPFETFTTSEPDSPDPDFRDLQYLLFQNSISYSYNATLRDYKKSGSHEARKKIFGIAPTYDIKSLKKMKPGKNGCHNYRYCRVL